MLCIHANESTKGSKSEISKGAVPFQRRSDSQYQVSTATKKLITKV
ncbi:unnamed protein product [Acidithrix sp. C25]|nr:unnamed protein product [Acidithrix sp. C25]